MFGSRVAREALAKAEEALNVAHETNTLARMHISACTESGKRVDDHLEAQDEKLDAISKFLQKSVLTLIGVLFSGVVILLYDALRAKGVLP